MRTLNVRGAFVFAVLFLALAWAFGAYLPSDTDVHFSAESGFYDEPVTLEMTCRVPGAEIYYTTDGSIPTDRSDYYDGPITLESTEDDYHTLSDYTGISHEDFMPEENMLRGRVIRAAVFRDGERLGDVHSAAYFVGVDRQSEYGDVPVVSLIMEEDDLFDYEKGIYTLGMAYDDWYEALDGEAYGWWELGGNFHNRGIEWERPVHVDYLPADGSEGFAQEMGVRIKGNATRIYNQKSLRLIARSEYGEKRVDYPLFAENTEYKQFLLRSGGNDCSYAKIRDPLVQNLSRGLRLPTQQSSPCVVFINGEYWGVYSLTEEYSDHYLERHFEIDRDNAILIKRFEVEEGQESDSALFEDMLTFVITNDMSDPETYAEAAQMLDMGNAADYFAVQLYVDNVDGIPQNNNNWQMWRARTLDSSNPYGDGRWRFVLFDIDGAADLTGDGWDFENDCLTPVLSEDGGNGTYFAMLLRSLCESETFRRQLVNALCDVRNIHFAPERFGAEMSALREAYQPLLPDTFRRFGPQVVLDRGVEEFCQNEMDRLEIYFGGRWHVFPWVMQSALDLQDPAECSLSVEGDGSVRMNESLLEVQDGFTGLYFPDYLVTVTAVETEGSRFVRWEGEGCSILEPEERTTEIAFESDFAVRAVFE